VVEMACNDSPALSAAPRSKHSYFSIVPSIFRSDNAIEKAYLPDKYRTRRPSLEHVELGRCCYSVFFDLLLCNLSTIQAFWAPSSTAILPFIATHSCWCCTRREVCVAQRQREETK
jgi:hypothetical protein